MAEENDDKTTAVETSIQRVGAVQWAMVIDTDRCTGCKACVIACRAENNIQTVGAEQVNMGRLMDWLRIDRFWEDEFHHKHGTGRLATDQEITEENIRKHAYEGDGYPNIVATFVPMLCQQCGTAPCESVCPVFASVHTNDGLNAQIYNRCVGTRVCANNCPYRVRILNFYSPQWDAPMEQMLNPDVSVRSEGVMEKCTFCVQRIRRASLDAKVAQKPLQDGELLPACAQACATNAIVFGDRNDHHSAVNQVLEENKSRSHEVLNELFDTRPNVIYLRPQRVPDAL